MEVKSLELNEDEMIEYIYNKLIERGFSVTVEAIAHVMDLEMQYMVENGFAEPME